MCTSQKYGVPYASLALVFLVSWGVDLVQAQATSPTCLYHGKVYAQGDTWADAHACDYCECNQYGVQCHAGLDGGPCKLKNMTASPGDPLCVYNMRPHLVGGVFTTLDGCNKCLCTERGMQCTAHPCKNTGFDTFSDKPLYGECLYRDKWYRFNAHWPAGDGCNTCFCFSIGNYRGGHECTRSTCKCANAVITG